MSAAYNTHQAAAAVGLSYERFRKVWRNWVRDMQFPRPFRGGPIARSTYSWRAEAVEEWKQRRERALGPGEAIPAAANEDAYSAPPRGPGVAKINRQRQMAQAFMKGSA